jgi:hypothetical protein
MGNNIDMKASLTPFRGKTGINRDSLKIILMMLMVLDHITFFIPVYLADAFHLLTRVVAVGFAYLVVEGLYYTHSRKDYLIRLFSWGVIMSLGNYLLNTFVLKETYKMSIIGDNIFLILAIGATMICIWDNHSDRFEKLFKGFAIFILIASIIPFVEGSFVLIPFMFITLITHENSKRRDICYLVLAVFLACIEIPMSLSGIDLNSGKMIFDSIAMNTSDVFFILIVPILHWYTGKLGKFDHQLKYLFYAFYPLHLWIIHLLANFLNK